MSNMHRILWFDQEVRSNHFPNCTQLAHQFELSTRQANRDIEYMVNSLGAPLQYDAKKEAIGIRMRHLLCQARILRKN